jgi:FMN phosphatase YigB (HAD superfamily)
MALTLEQYAELLDQRDEPRPAGPEPLPFHKAKPHLPVLPDVHCVVWSGYGALMLLAGDEPHLLNPDPVMQAIALDKTIQEFHMWASMTRKPTEPHKHMASMLQQVLDKQMSLTAKDAELRFDRVWRGILDRLFQKEYHYERATYGDEKEFAQKICYYYLLRSQGVSIYADELKTLREIHRRGVKQGVHADGQCNAAVQLLRCLKCQGKIDSLDELFEPSLRLWSYETGVKKHSDQSFALLVKALRRHGLETLSVLYVGNDPERDVAPAKRRGFRTALFLGDRRSTNVTPETLKSARTRPDALITAISQVPRVLAS